MPYESIHLLIVHDHALVADSFEAYLTSRGEPIRVSKATSMPQALAIAEVEEDLSLALLDLHMPGMNGLTGLGHLRERRPNLPVAILSGDASPSVARMALQAGASGFIPKSLGGPAVLAAIQLILAGARYLPADLAQEARTDHVAATGLSQREREVLHALIDGRSNKQIASAMQITSATVALHLTNVYRKLNVTTRGQAVRRAFELGYKPNAGAPDVEVL